MVAKWIVQIMDCVCVHAGSLSSSRQDHKFHLFPAVGKQNVGGKRRKKKSLLQITVSLYPQYKGPKTESAKWASIN